MSTKPGDDTIIFVGANCKNCDWCLVLMGFHEASTSSVSKGVHPNEVTYNLCYTCREFDSKALMEAAKKGIIAEAINPELSESYGYPWI